jgi:hypothetical protein
MLILRYPLVNIDVIIAISKNNNIGIFKIISKYRLKAMENMTTVKTANARRLISAAIYKGTGVFRLRSIFRVESAEAMDTAKGMSDARLKVKTARRELGIFWPVLRGPKPFTFLNSHARTATVAQISIMLFDIGKKNTSV